MFGLKRLFAVLTYFVLCLTAFGQARYDWRYRAPGFDGHTTAHAAAVLTNGDVVVTSGGILGTSSTTMLECTDPRGNRKWSISPSAPDAGTGLAIASLVAAPDGTFYAGAHAGYPSGYGYDVANIVLIHFAADGTVLNAGRVPSGGNCVGYKVAIGPDGSPHTLTYWGNYGDTGLTKWNPDATVAWHTVYDSGTSDFPAAFDIDPLGNVVAAFQSRALPDPNRFIARIAKFDANGTKLWEYAGPSTLNSQLTVAQTWVADIKAAANGEVWACGKIIRDASPSDTAGFTIRVFSDGTLYGTQTWSLTWAGLGNSEFQSLDVDDDGNVRMAGTVFEPATNSWRLCMPLVRTSMGQWSVVWEDLPAQWSPATAVQIKRLPDGMLRVYAQTYTHLYNRSQAVWHLDWGVTDTWSYQLFNQEVIPMAFASLGAAEDAAGNLYPFGHAYTLVPSINDYRLTSFVGRFTLSELPVPTYDVSAYAPLSIAMTSGLEGSLGYPGASQEGLFQPVGGTVALTPGIGFDWTPNGSATPGSASFTASFVYGAGMETNSGPRKVNLILHDKPTAQDDLAACAEDSLVQVPVLDNDTHPDDPILAVTSFGQGANGKVTLQGDLLQYKPNRGFFGSDSFTYTVSDPWNGASSATVTIAVSAAPLIQTYSPNEAMVGTTPTVAFEGRGFVAGAVVTVNGVDRTTSFVSEGSLTAALAPSDTAVAGNLKLRVRLPDGRISNQVNLVVGAPTLKLAATRVAGTSQVDVTVSNTGKISANDVIMASAMLGSDATSSALPINGGKLGAGGTWTVRLAFPASAFVGNRGTVTVSLSSVERGSETLTASVRF